MREDSVWGYSRTVSRGFARGARIWCLFHADLAESKATAVFFQWTRGIREEYGGKGEDNHRPCQRRHRQKEHRRRRWRSGDRRGGSEQRPAPGAGFTLFGPRCASSQCHVTVTDASRRGIARSRARVFRPRPPATRVQERK